MSRILSQITQLGQLFRPLSTGMPRQIPSFGHKPFGSLGNNTNPFQDGQSENPFKQNHSGQNLPFEKPRFLGYHNTRAIYVGGRLNINS